ncbi:hypothetical protein BH24ACT15_BH24ACT15_24560 [soil metagenome]
MPTGASSPESASAGSDGERLDRRGWNLDEITADGMFVAVSIFYGGCDRSVGTEVEEPGEEVRITTIFAVPRGVNACNDMLRGAREIIALQRPLNDRELTGCGMGDCQSVLDDDDLLYSVERPALSGTTVVATTPNGIVGLDRQTGQEQWRIPQDSEGFGGRIESPTAVGPDGVFVQTSETGLTTVLDARDGNSRRSAPGDLIYSSRLDEHSIDDTVLLTPDLTDVQAREASSGDIRWEARPKGDVITQLLAVEDAVLVMSGRYPSDNDPGQTSLTMYDLADGSVRWQRDLPGGPGDIVRRAEVAAVQVRGAVYGINLEDGSERWRILPFNVDGLVDMGPMVLAEPNVVDNPGVLFDPATGLRTGQRSVVGLYDGQSPDMRNHPVIGQDAIIAEDGALTRRDVSKTLSVEPDPNPAWMRTLPARLSPGLAPPSQTAIYWW